MASAKLTSLVLKEVFGETVGATADELLRWNGQALATLLRCKHRHVRESLAVLIQHNVVTFSKDDKGRTVYTLDEESALHLLRYSRFLQLAKNLFGDEGELVVEELFCSGQDLASQVILRGAKRIDGGSGAQQTVEKLKATFKQMADCHFLRRVTDSDEETGRYAMPEVDDRAVISALSKDEASMEKPKDEGVLWRVNCDRFLREFRDQIVVQAVTRRIDSSAGNLMRVFLTIMNETAPWAGVSHHVHQVDVTSRIEDPSGSTKTAVVADEKLAKFPDQYVKVLEEDRTRFVDRVGDAGGGQYVVNAKHIFTELAAAAADGIVLEKFGSKALRIFRVVRQRLHVEESQLQGLVMIPAKEIKLLTYQLLEDHFIQLEELRKSMASSGPSKCFYLFYVDMNQVARMIAELCYKAMENAYIRRNFETVQNQRLLDKQEKVESLCTSLKLSAAAEDNNEELQLQLQEINDMLSPVERESAKKIHDRIDQLGRARGQIDETLQIVNLFLRYGTS